MKIAIVAAGFSPTEADELRRAMATFKAKGKISYFEQKLINGMVSKGYTLEYAQRVFRQLEGFGSYGFPESHAVSFALLVYVSSWIKCYYPDVFACALLNSMPMGFYQPAQIVIDAQKHGVAMLPVDVNHSEWDNKLEGKDGKYYALRLGFRQVRGLREDDMKVLVAGRKNGYVSIHALREAGLTEAVLERLADADAFRSLSLDRRNALWHVTTKDHQRQALLRDDHREEKDIALPGMSLSEHVIHDYASTSLSIKAHPVSFIRPELLQLKVLSARELGSAKHGDRVRTAGLILVRQRPGTAKGVCFITLEDETGTSNLVVFHKLFDKYRKEIIQSKLLMVEGELQREGEVIHVIVERCHNVSRLLGKLALTTEELLSTTPKSRSDETSSPFLDKKHSGIGIQGNIFPDGRNFK